MNIVPASDNLVAQRLLTDPRIDMISFTGSTAVGRLIQRLSQEGINLTGIRRILALQSELEEAQRRMDDMTELVRRLVEQHESQGRRIFSAGSTGNVAQGRFYHLPLALPGR